MTSKEIHELLSKAATLHGKDGMDIAVRIVDAREAYGRLDVRVTPVAGSGEVWVNADRVTINGGEGDAG